MSPPRREVAVAAPHRLAAEAGARAVAEGGNAVDAAIAAAAVLAVVYPHQCSIGGDLIALVCAPSGEVYATLSVGAAARRTPVDEIRAAHERMPGRGPLTVTVPGFTAGLAALAAQGARLDLAEAWRTAADLAERGVPAAAGLAAALRANRSVLAADPGSAAVLLGDGGGSALRQSAADSDSADVLSRGDGDDDSTLRQLVADSESANALLPGDDDTILRQPALATTLMRLAEDPLDLYTGESAALLAAGLRRLGSPLAADDLAGHRAEVAEPIHRRRGDVCWFVPPPPSQAVALPAVLGRTPGLTAAELLDRSLRVAAARDALLADPRVFDVPVKALYAAAEDDGPPIALSGAVKPAGDTVAVTAADTEGYAVSIVASVYQSFGAGLLEPATGVLLHNRGSAFSLDPDHPGFLRPGARPPHTLSPAIAVRGGVDPMLAALGCQGGRAQPWILAQLADELLRADDLARVLRRPRWVFGSREIGEAEPTLVVEHDSVPADLAEVAAAHGLRTRALGAAWDDAGHVQAALADGRGARGAADPRADGGALTVQGEEPR
jgi:gamma-glutamyltranspeptidase